jgi:large conductance mechanosensitive channel
MFKKIITGGRTAVEPTTRLIRPGLSGFKQFLMRGNIVDLAVAVVIGTAFTAVVTSLVSNLLTPLIAAIGGKPDFAQLTFTVHNSTFKYGQFLNSLVSFFMVAVAIYFIVVLPIAKVNELRRRGQADAEEQPAVSDEVKVLTEIRELLADGQRRVTRERDEEPRVTVPRGNNRRAEDPNG